MDLESVAGLVVLEALELCAFNPSFAAHPGWPTRPQPSKVARLALSVAALAVRWAVKSATV